MATFTSKISPRTQLIITAIGASLATATLLQLYNDHNRRVKRRQLDEEIQRSIAAYDFAESADNKSETGLEAGDFPSVSTISTSDRPVALDSFKGPGEYDETLIREQLARNYAFFGEEGMQRIRQGTVAVIGCGGVGSWAAVMLVRSGVSKIRLVDFDYVSLSSLNRHATATLADVGTPKVNCIAKTLKQIATWAEVDSRLDIWRKEAGGHLLEGVDWVIDAIDNIQTKVDLLKYCHDNKIKVFSSMGAGAKCDPTRIQISDISSTIYDPLARSVRRRLRLLGVDSGIPVVYSTEVPGDVKLLPLPEEEFQKGSVGELGVLEDFRVRILPVLGPLPAIFGLNIATYVTCELSGKPIPNPLPIKNRKKLYERLYRDLLHRETKIAGHQMTRLPIDEDDVALIFEDIHRGRSIIPPHDVPSRPTLVRWDPNLPLSLENCVVFELNSAKKHVRECWDAGGIPKRGVQPDDIWGEEVALLVARRREEVKRLREWISQPTPICGCSPMVTKTCVGRLQDKFVKFILNPFGFLTPR